MPDDDCILQDLKKQEAYATNWIISARQVCDLVERVFLEILPFSAVLCLNLPSMPKIHLILDIIYLLSYSRLLDLGLVKKLGSIFLHIAKTDLCGSSSLS